MIIGDALFYNGDLDDYLRAQMGAIEGHVLQHVTKADLVRTDAEIVAGLLPGARVDPLEVDFDHPQKDVAEARIEVDDFFNGSATIDGVRATRSFAFTGDRGLFQLRTNPFSLVLPHGLISSSRVTVGIEGRNDPETLKREIDRQQEILREHVERSYAQIDRHNAALPGALTQAVGRRRETLAGLDDLRTRL